MLSGGPANAQEAANPPFSCSRSAPAEPFLSVLFLSRSGLPLTADSSIESTRRPPVIGILGGIGSGKSSIVRRIRDWNLQFIDADRIGHDLLQDSTVQRQLRQHFGNSIFSSPDIIDRKKLAVQVFGSSPRHAERLQILNSILHPAIRKEIEHQIESAEDSIDAIILDAALLLEGGWDKVCRHLIFIDTPQPLRQQRVLENRGWSVEEHTKRETAQWPVELKLKRADFVVDNSGTVENATRQMKQILQAIL